MALAYTPTTLEYRMNRCGIYFPERYGIKPGKSTAAQWDAMFKAIPPHAEVRLQSGGYVIEGAPKPIVKPVKLVGVHGMGWEGSTQLWTTGVGWHLDTDYCLLKNLVLFGSNYQGLGLRVSGVNKLECVTISHFSEGIDIYASLDGGNKRDSSRNQWNDVRITNCRRYGLLVLGGDANQCEFRSLDIRDIGFSLTEEERKEVVHENKITGIKAMAGAGLIDASFLGNDFYSPHFNNCQGGAIYVTDANSYTSFYGLYLEDGQRGIVTDKTAFYGNRVFESKIQGGTQFKGGGVSKLWVDELNVSNRISLMINGGPTWSMLLEKDVWTFNFQNLDFSKIALVKDGDRMPNGGVAPGVGFARSYIQSGKPEFTSIY